MTRPVIDTDIIIRLVSGDDLVRQVAARDLFARIERGEETTQAPVTVIADAVFVLASPQLYALPRGEVAERLRALVRLPGFRVRDRRVVLRALDVYESTRLDFGDAMIVASAVASGSHAVYSYDRHFDRFPDIERIEP